MTTQMFLNLPVKNLNRSVEFFTQLGYTFNPNFTNENATCMIINNDIFVLLLVEKFFQTFTEKQICDTTKNTEAIIALSCASRAEVDVMVRKAVAAGGTTPRKPVDHGFMYSHGYDDLDGHIWEVFYMEPGATPG